MLRLGALGILLVNGVLGDSWTLSFYTATQFDAGSCTGDTNDNPPVCCHGDWSNVNSVQLTGAADAIALVFPGSGLDACGDTNSYTQTFTGNSGRVFISQPGPIGVMNVNDFDNNYNNVWQ